MVNILFRLLAATYPFLILVAALAAWTHSRDELIHLNLSAISIPPAAQFQADGFSHVN